MTSLAATLLDVQVPTGLKAHMASHEDPVHRDDVFFSLMQEPAAPTLEKEQEPPCEIQTKSKEDLAGKNEEASDLDKAETQEKKDLFSRFPEDAPIDELAFPREWKEVMEATRTHETFQKSTQTPLTPAPAEEMNIDFIPKTQAVLSKEADALKTEHLLPHSEKIIPEPKIANVQESKIGTEPALDKNLPPLTKESASPAKDLLIIAPQIDQKENSTSFLSDKKISEKIEKTDGSTLRPDLKNADQSTDNPIPFNIKTQDKDLVLSQKEPLPSFEGTPTQKATPVLKKALDHKIPPVATNASPEKKTLSSTATAPLGFEKISSFDATGSLSQELATNFSLEAPVDKKAAPSETLSPLQNAKPQEDASEMSSYKAVTLDIKMPSKDTPGSLKLRLDPANLGRVEVKVHITHDGRMDAVVSVAKSETFELLQKDAGALHKAIADAFEQDESAMSFTLTGGEKGSSQESFTAFHKNTHSQDNLELASGERALTYTPKPLDPARMLDALV